MKTKYFVARCPVGKTFMFVTNSAFYVTPKKARAVADILNRKRYELFPGQEWQVFKDDGEWTANVWRRAVISKGHIRIYEIDN